MDIIFMLSVLLHQTFQYVNMLASHERVSGVQLNSLLFFSTKAYTQQLKYFLLSVFLLTTQIW